MVERNAKAIKGIGEALMKVADIDKGVPDLLEEVEKTINEMVDSILENVEKTGNATGQKTVDEAEREILNEILVG